MLKGYKEIAEMAYDDCIEALKTETDEEVLNMLQERLAELEESVIRECKKLSDFESYLNHYPNGRFCDDAKESIRIIEEKNKSQRHRRIIWCMILAVVLVVICYKNYHPVTYFNYEANALYDKTGGTRTISFSTDALTKNIKVLSNEMSIEALWLDAKMEGRKLRMTADTNFCSGKRTEIITVRAYSSFFGLLYGGITQKISATQY